MDKIYRNSIRHNISMDTIKYSNILPHVVHYHHLNSPVTDLNKQKRFVYFGINKDDNSLKSEALKR